jgi:hypothetical protein
MKEVHEHRPQRNRNPDEMTFWCGEHQLNQREILRLTLSNYQGQPILDLRRWLDPGGGQPPRPTKKGVGCALNHLLDIAALVNEALRQARGLGLLPPLVRDAVKGGRE